SGERPGPGRHPRVPRRRHELGLSGDSLRVRLRDPRGNRQAEVRPKRGIPRGGPPSPRVGSPLEPEGRAPPLPGCPPGRGPRHPGLGPLPPDRRLIADVFRYKIRAATRKESIMPQPKLLPWGILLLLSLFAPSCGGGGSASSGGGAPPPPPPPQPPPPPVGANGLPTTFRFGLGNGPGDVDWMTTSGAAWSYRYQYLSGNVSGGNWSQWNSPAGEFAKIYMNESKD